jgi:hypothetical protein
MDKKYVGRDSYFKHYIRIDAKYMTVFYFGIVLLAIKGTDMNPFPVLWNYIKGFSYLEFNIIEFIYYIFPAAITLFIMDSAWEKDAKNRNVQAMLRVGSRKRWKELLEKRSLTYASISLSLHIVIALCLYAGTIIDLVSEGRIQQIEDTAVYYDIAEEKIYISIVICLCLRIIEWMILYSMNKMIYSISHSCITAYILTMAAYIPGFLFGAYYPLGKGSLYQVLEILDSIGESGIVLVIGINLVLVIFLYVVPVLAFRLKRRCAYECSN